MRLYLTGTDYSDSVLFTITVGEILATDPMPDGPRPPALYWAYDDIDTLYPQHPTYDWVEVNGVGTRINFSQNDDVVAGQPAGRVRAAQVLRPALHAGVDFGRRLDRLRQLHDVQLLQHRPAEHLGPARDGVPQLGRPLPGSGGDGAGYVYYYHDAANHRFVVEYDSVQYYSAVDPRQVRGHLLRHDGRPRPRATTPSSSQYMTAAGFTSSTVGIQDPTRPSRSRTCTTARSPTARRRLPRAGPSSTRPRTRPVSPNRPRARCRARG